MFRDEPTDVCSRHTRIIDLSAVEQTLKAIQSSRIERERRLLGQHGKKTG